MLRSGAIGFGEFVVRRPLECKDPSLTVQSEAENCDINVIMKRFMQSGMLPQIQMPPLATDFAQITTFEEAMGLIVKARESFEALPADVRNRFGNSPQAFLDFCDDERNIPEMLKLGLAVPKEKIKDPDAPINVRVIPDAPKAS